MNQEKKAWQKKLKDVRLQKPVKQTPYQNLKGIGPNKASGHKGGISRQGSKRG